MCKLIKERAGDGLCPICTVLLPSDFKRVVEGSEVIWVCKKHPVPEEYIYKAADHETNTV